MVKVLNLVISGIPSIPLARFTLALEPRCFKPCYKWNTFNTNLKNVILNRVRKVLNLVISGIPSILWI